MVKRPCLKCGFPADPVSTCLNCGTNTGRDYADERKRRAILDRYRLANGDRCKGTPWCDIPFVPHYTTDLTVDHTVPRSAGGTLEQYSIMCRQANSKKSDDRFVPPTRGRY